MDSGDKQKAQNSSIEQGICRHTPYQKAKLEEVFKNCQHPDAKVRRQLSANTGLHPKQIKFWFQNKRTQVKAVNERNINDSLLLENEQIQSENIKLRETLKKVLCLSCGGPTLVEEDHESCMQKLKLENSLLHQEHERLSKLLESENRGKNSILPPTLTSSNDPLQESLPNQNVENPLPVINPTLFSTLSPPSQHDPSHGSLPKQNFDVPSLEINPIMPSTFSSSSHDHLSQGSLLNQNNPIMSPITLPPSPHDHPTQGSFLNKNIEISALVQNVSTITPELDQNILPLTPANDNQDIFSLHEDLLPLNLDFDALQMILDDYEWPKHTDIITTTNMEKTSMMEIANTAMEELTRLLRINEPFWFRSIWNDKFILQRVAYVNTFHRVSRLKGPRAHIESSKDSGIVSMGRTQLVEMFLDADKWVDLFPTIVRKAQTIQVFESGLSGSRNGALQLMNAEMHILSPLIPSREFIFLRYCKKIEEGLWVISDVSFDTSKYEATLSRAWRLPSGCMIHENTNRSCRISWVEHVEVNDKIETNNLFRQVICDNNAYGAKRWVLTLERMCERFERASLENMPSFDARGVISSAEGRRSVMQLGHRMIKIYHGILDTSSNVDVPPHLTRLNNDQVRVSIRKNTELGLPNGMIISAVTSFSFPLSPEKLLDLLKDISKRPKWDVLCNDNPAHEIQHIPTGIYSNNSTTIIQPFIPRENGVLILQESYMDTLESMLVYAPMDIKLLNFALMGEDSSSLPLLPSGFTIIRDDRSNAIGGQSAGSLVTLGYQILVCSTMEDLNVENAVASLNKLVISTVEKIMNLL